MFKKQSQTRAEQTSEKNDFYHERTLYNIPSDADIKYETVDLIEINQFEYKKLKTLNLKTPEEIIDAFVMSLLEEKII